MANGKIKGAFVFRNDGDGCLAAKYLEHNESDPFPESCKKISNDEDTPGDFFTGTFNTSWLEAPSISGERAKLSITCIKNTNVYDLKWNAIEVNSSLSYRGKAMLYDGLLIGSYWIN